MAKALKFVQLGELSSGRQAFDLERCLGSVCRAATTLDGVDGFEVPTWSAVIVGQRPPIMEVEDREPGVPRQGSSAASISVFFCPSAFAGVASHWPFWPPRSMFKDRGFGKERLYSGECGRQSLQGSWRQQALESDHDLPLYGGVQLAVDTHSCPLFVADQDKEQQPRTVWPAKRRPSGRRKRSRLWVSLPKPAHNPSHECCSAGWKRGN